MFRMDTLVLSLGNEVSYNGNGIIISQMNEIDSSFALNLCSISRGKPQGNMESCVLFQPV